VEDALSATGSPPPPTARRLFDRVARPVPLALAGVLIGALVLRLIASAGAAGRLDADEAVTGVMAQRIQDGDFFTFFAGQDYMGTVEQYLQALVLWVTPDTAVWLRSVQIALAVAACGLVYLVGRQVIASPWGAVLAAAVFAVGPYYNVLKGTRSHGAYAFAVVLCLAAVLIALRFDARSRRAPLLAVAFGVLAGLGLWQTLLVAYVMIPAALWLAASARGQLRSLIPLGAGGFVVGALPLIVARISEGRLNGGGESPQPPSSIADRAAGLLDPVLSMFVGAGRLGAGAPVTHWIAPALAVVAALGIAGAAVWARRAGLLDLVTLRTGRREPIDLVVASFPLALVLYVLSDYTWFTGEPRYLFTLYPMLALGLAAIVMRCGRLTPLVGAALVVLLLGLTTIQLRDAVRADGFPPVVGGGVIYSEDADDIVAVARQEGVEALYAEYWLAYPIQFAAGDALAVSALTVDRFPALEREVREAADPPAFVTPEGDGAERMDAALRSLGVRFQRRPAARAVLFYDLSRPVSAGEVLAAGACAGAVCG
jgi:hypothetical protein